MTYEKAQVVICDSLKSLQRSEIINDSMGISANTIILGMGSELDSLGFVSFISDLEERLSVETGEEIYLVLNDIHDFNGDNSHLDLDTLTRFIVDLTQSSE